MLEFDISMHSFQQIQNFVHLAMVQPFEILVGNEHQNVNGKDLMGMFCLDLARPIRVYLHGPEGACISFRDKILSLND